MKLSHKVNALLPVKVKLPAPGTHNLQVVTANRTTIVRKLASLQ